MILNLAIILFICLETMNVLIMYFKPDFRYGNSMATFQGWADSKRSEQDYLFTKYLVNWVANCKVIFILLLTIILLFGDETIKFIGVMVTTGSIGLYFITLHPIIRKLDSMGTIHPQGYSRTLGLMIGGCMVMFSLALLFH